MTKQARSARDSEVYQLADSLTAEQLKIELDATPPAGIYADTIRKALGRSTKRALTTTQYGAKLAVARAILKRKAQAARHKS